MTSRVSSRCSTLHSREPHRPLDFPARAHKRAAMCSLLAMPRGGQLTIAEVGVVSGMTVCIRAYDRQGGVSPSRGPAPSRARERSPSSAER